MWKRNFVISLQKFLFENYSVAFAINIEFNKGYNIFTLIPHPPPKKGRKVFAWYLNLVIIIPLYVHSRLFLHHTFGTVTFYLITDKYCI